MGEAESVSLLKHPYPVNEGEPRRAPGDLLANLSGRRNTATDGSCQQGAKIEEFVTESAGERGREGSVSNPVIFIWGVKAKPDIKQSNKQNGDRWWKRGLGAIRRRERMGGAARLPGGLFSYPPLRRLTCGPGLEEPLWPLGVCEVPAHFHGFPHADQR